MGRVKDDWMRWQELEPMHDWIIEHYGDDAGEEGSDEWDEAVRAFDSHCEKQMKKEEEDRLLGELEWYIYSESPVVAFNKEMRSIKELLHVSAKSDTQSSLFSMLYAHTVASMESFLAAVFINKVTNSEHLIRRIIETDPKFSKMKFTLNEIFKKNENLKLIVAEYLKNIIFHDINKVKPMFKSVLGCDFGNVSWLFKAVLIRHDCVHRAGWDKEGNRVEISSESILQLLDKCSCLVNKIDVEIAKISNERDLLLVKKGSL